MSVVKISGLDAVMDGAAFRNAVGYNAGGRSAYLGLYTGKKPSPVEVAGNADIYRRSDRLWSNVMQNGLDLIQEYQVTGNAFIYPEKEGDCTWFLYAGVETIGKTMHGVLIGDVTSTSGAGDLILTATHLLPSMKYRIQKLAIKIPYTFTY